VNGIHNVLYCHAALRIRCFHEGRGRENLPPRGVEKSMLIFEKGSVYGKESGTGAFLGDRPPPRIRQERSMRDRTADRYLSAFGLDGLFCSFHVDPQT